jgi:hypothetical protein
MYREIKIPVLIITPFSYNKHNQGEPKELNAFSHIALILDI